jgi:tetratricopeptide (TPR) repeat protein
MDRSTALARSARRQLGLGQAKDAAWLALYALELDRRCGLAHAVLAQIILELNEDPLATLATRHALSLPIPDVEREEVERFHRADLWTRGLLMHDTRASMLALSDFVNASRFEPTPKLDRWIEEQSRAWGGVEAAADALTRMAAAMSDARVVPETDANPLRIDEGWSETPAFAAWKAAVEVHEPANDEPRDTASIHVLSDHWMEQEILSFAASGSLEMALERARLWASLRPNRIGPRVTLVRLHHALDDLAARDAAVEEIARSTSTDLNELEDARVVLGELMLFEPQIQVLDRMDRIAPDHPVILANRGVALLEIGEAERAEADLTKAIELDPSSALALATLGLIRMRRDDYLGARDVLDRAVAIEPEQSQLRVYLAACKNNQGSKEAAISELEEALRIDPGNDQARELLEELRKL